jgi:hypothetical protein
VLQLAQTLSPAEMRWLRDALDRVMETTALELSTLPKEP